MLVWIKYSIHTLEDKLLAAHTDDESDHIFELSDELLKKYLQRAQLEVKLYGDSMDRDKRIKADGARAQPIDNSCELCSKPYPRCNEADQQWSGLL